MQRSREVRVGRWLAAGAALAAGVLAAAPEDALAGPRRRKAAAVVGRAEVPLGLQGLRGAGGNVVVPFTLVDPTRTATDVEVQYGIDRDASGSITEDEYLPAKEDRLDPRDTRKNRKPQVFVTAGDIGATHAFVWRSTDDILFGRHEVLQYRYTPQGRLIPDPAHPGEFLFDDAQAGVRIRIRAVRGAGRSRLVGDWAYTDPFSINNNSKPSMTIDAVLPNASGTASDEHVEVLWTAIDPDTEDRNGNGKLDNGEDRNGNGIFDQEQVGVAFDYYRVQPGEDPSAMTDEELAALTWKPCTRALGQGDTDSFVEPAPGPGQTDRRIFGSPDGRSWRFVWDSIADVGTVHDRFVLRAKPVDAKKENGEFVYLRTPFLLDNWKVFTSAAAGEPALALAAARAGATATNLVYGLEQSDALAGKAFLQVLVAGGSTSENGAAVATLEVFNLSPATSDSTSGSPVAFASLLTARKYHTATPLSDGRVLFAGGFDATGVPTAATEIYDPKTRSVTAGPSLNAARARHAAVLLGTNDVAFLGGVGASGAVLDTVEIYRFTPAGEASVAVDLLPVRLPVAQHSSHAILLPDQTVLVAGGITGAADASGAGVRAAAVLDPLAGPVDAGVPGGVKTKTPSITAVGDLLEARKFATATPLLDGNVLFAGGFDGAAKTSLEVYDWSERRFEPVTSALTVGRSQHAGALLGDGSVLLAGGATNDPSGGTVTVTPTAEVFVLGATDGASWTGSFRAVNGDMVVPRRGASVAVTMAGRPFLAGGIDAAGAATAICEVYTPDGSRNAAPKAYVNLPSKFLSHAFGAPIDYRIVDAELDRARIVAQFRHPARTTWNACSSQATTIGGDVADSTAGLETTDVDLDGTEFAIDPIAQNTAGDHSFIWSMARDIDRPLPGTTVDGYTIRVTPYGAVQGERDVTEPVTVLYNTKAITTILPLQDTDGPPNPRQGGDVAITVHVRDIDGPGIGPRPGEVAEVAFYYAIDANADGQLTPPAEDWILMTPAKVAAGFPPTTPNPLPGVTTWSEAFDDASSDPQARPAFKGWVTFQWDALFDLGPPPSPSYELRNVWIQAIATDADLGFPKVLRNKQGQADEFVYVRDADGLWLESFSPRGGNANAVRVNEPLDFVFNGRLEPSTVNAETLRVHRGATQVLGTFQIQEGVAIRDGVASSDARKTTVTFHPQPQELVTGAAKYAVGDTDTVLFAGNEYRIHVPGYETQGSPFDDDPATVRPRGYGSDPTLQSTYQLVNSTPVDGDAESGFRFRTVSGHFADGQGVAFVASSPTPPAGTSLSGDAGTSGFLFDFDHALDVATVTDPNVVVRGNSGQAYVVPGRWTVTNTVGADGSSRARLVFTPLFKLPSGDAILVATSAGLLGTNGTPATGPAALTYSVAGYGRTSASGVESFTTTDMNDTSYTNATWGTDPCAGTGVLTGSQDGATQPNPNVTTDLTVNNGQTVTLSSASYDYRNVTVNKGGTLVLRSTSGPMTIRANGDVRIDGTLDFSGAEGDSGSHGYNYYWYGATYSPYNVSNGKRAGGTGYNGGGSGGASTNSSSDHTNGDDGGDGSGTSGTGGTGGQRQTAYTPRTTSYYYMGVGGGAGGGHARDGVDGGRASNYLGTSSSFPAATRGFAATSASDFSSGVTAGGGGGGGGMMLYSSSYQHSGGGGGAGAGAVTILCDGTFTLGPAGFINGQGGQGGSKSHFAGAGGGGAGGGLWIKAGSGCTLDGVVDLRGGRGGPCGMTYYSDYYHYISATTYGTARMGGDGSPGRLVVEAPNYLPGRTDNVRVFGQLLTRQITSLPAWTSIATSSVPSTLSSGGTTDLGGVTDVRYASLTVNAGALAKLRNGTGSSNKAVRIWVDGPVTVGGTLSLNGNGCPPAVNSIASTADIAPFSTTQVSQTNSPTSGFSTTDNTSAYTTGYYGVVGGGDGGRPAGNSATASYKFEAYDGFGPTANPTSTALGKHKYKINTWPSSPYYEAGDVGGSGGGNATSGRDGWPEYAQGQGFSYTGSVADTTGNGVRASQRATDSSRGGAAQDGSAISTSNFGSFGGAGGGGGNSGGYTNYSWNNMAGFGGGGGGAVCILSQSTITISSGGAIEARGGDGNCPGGAYYYDRGRGAGGAGSGGIVYLVADRVVLAAASSEVQTSGATVDVRGGFGGGWRQRYSGTRNRFPEYQTFGNFGGDGGYGRLVIDYKTSLNGGNALANKYGYEQASFTDASNQYRALAGQATFKCRGKPGGTLFRTKFFDLGSLRPTVTSLVAGTVGANTTLVLQGQGAQSHPHDPGPTGVGTFDTGNVSSTVSASSSLAFDGWRWWRLQGTLTRLSSTGVSPTADDFRWNYDTDN